MRKDADQAPKRRRDASSDPNDALELRAGTDIKLDEAKLVRLDGNGLSVAAHWLDLPKHLIPARLDDGSSGASGPNDVYCWRMGEGDFLAAPLNHSLTLYIKKKPRLGCIGPPSAMTQTALQDALDATRPDWSIDEE